MIILVIENTDLNIYPLPKGERVRVRGLNSNASPSSSSSPLWGEEESEKISKNASLMQKICACSIFACLVFSSAVFANANEQAVMQQPRPPFIGKIKSDNVNLRAGANQNYEILSKTNKGDLVSVIGEAYGWYKVTLPKAAYCYAWKEFIEVNSTDPSAGVSKVSRFNLRARPSKESTILCQIAKGDTVTILNADTEGWYQISPPANCYGWVRTDLVEYHSDINAVQPQPVTDKKEKVSKKIIKSAEDNKAEKRKKGFLWW